MEEDGPENAWPSRASVPEDHQQTASLTQTLDPENAQRSQSLADEAGAQLQHTRTSLTSRLQIQRHDDDAWGEAASQTGQENHKEEAAVTKERQGSHSGSKVTNDQNLAWQRTRTSLASRAPVQRHDDDAWESSSHNSRGSKGPEAHKKGPCLMQSSHTKSRQLSDPAAADAKAPADHQRTSASAGPVQKDDDGWGSDWGSARPSQASVPEDHKKQAASLTQSLYARYAERSDPAADDAKAPAGHQRTSASAGPVQKDDDGWGSDHWGSARPSQASVPEDHKKQAASLTQSLYARYAERSDPAADDAKAPAHHQRTSASAGPVQKDDDGWGSDHWGSARPSQASVPEDHKKQAASLTQSLYARYADDERSDPAADDAKAPAGHQRTSASAGPVQKDDDGWGSDWGSARPSQASVPEDHKKQAASLTQSLYARYAERSDPAADDAKAPAGHQRTSATVVQQAEHDVRKVSSVHSGQDLSAPKPSDADQVAETVEEEEEVFTKE